METNIRQTTQFVINKLSIISKLGEVDVSDKFEELNLYDSIFNTAISGNIVIRDAIGLSSTLLFDGSEVLYVDISKDGQNLSFKKSYRIFKQSNRKNVNMSSEMYVLSFVSDEFIFSMQKKVGQYFGMTYSEAAVKVLTDYLRVSDKKKIIVSQSLGVREIVPPNLNPLKTIELFAIKAVDKELTPNFIFFENRIGFNFVTLSRLFELDSVATINFNPKNIPQTGMETEFLGARDYKIKEQFNFVKNVKSGVYAGTIVAYDTLTGEKYEKKLNFNEFWKKNSHANKSPKIGIVDSRDGLDNTKQYESRRISVFSPSFRKNSSYIKEKSPESLSLQDNAELYSFQRRMIFENLMTRRVNVSLPGNFTMTSGLCVDLNFSKKSASVDNTLDQSVYGKYLISACRHIIRPDFHETIIEAVTDSSNYEGVTDSSFSSTFEQLSMVK